MKNGETGSESGYTYFGLLLAVLGASLAVSAGAALLGNEARRDKEAELMFAGDEIRRALELYHAKNAEGPHPFPKKMEWLLRDPNQPSLQRYLRRIYRDPVHDQDVEDAPVASGPSGEWVVIVDANGQIVGVHSNSAREPLKRAGFPKRYEAFGQAKRYSEWKFIAAGGAPAEPKAGSAAPPKIFFPVPVVPLVPVAPVSPPAPILPPAAPSALSAPPPPPAPSPLSAPPPPPAPSPPPEMPAPPVEPPPHATSAGRATPPAAPAQSPLPPAAPALPAAAVPASPAAGAQAEANPAPSGPQPFIMRAPKQF